MTLPVATSTNSSMEEAYILGGANGMLIAVDTIGSGHITTYPTDESTVGLQIHFADAEDIPAHCVVSEGPCYLGRTGGQIV